MLRSIVAGLLGKHRTGAKTKGAQFGDTLTIDVGKWSGTFRPRSRFEVEVPFTQWECAWKKRTWYGLADVEPAYTFGEAKIDPVRLRVGVEYIVSERLELEFLYAHNHRGRTMVACNTREISFA